MAAPAVRLTTADDNIDFWHKTFDSPAITTFIHAVENGWISIPGVTPAILRRHPPHAIETSLGHLTATRKGLRSTKKQPTIGAEVKALDRNVRSVHNPLIYSRIYECTGRMHSDAAGCFPIKSASGKSYMIIFFCEDGNYIHVECTASRKAQDLLQAFQNASK